jgi:hypothetical protein
MNDYFSPNVLIVALTFFFAGGVKGVTGMGLPTVAMGILGVVMPPVSAASLLIVPSFVTNFWQLFTGPDFLSLVKKVVAHDAWDRVRHHRGLIASDECQH